MTEIQRPEVLAPAGSPDCLPAAVAGGADAVFLGLRHFNARGRAENFRKADLPRHVEYLHRHDLKCYVVLNTLVHDDEYPKALELARCAHEAGVDATIVQDLGLWTTLARELPGLKRHASTQMTVHHPSQIAVLARVGAERVILARELTLAEVAECAQAASALGVEVEHFVHGALCYAFSGQCLMSNFAGCRSANRGTCAQNCRFGYHSEGKAPLAHPDGHAHSVEPETLLSLRDLSLVNRVSDLADAGVASLKIEGRLKGPEYVYTVSKVYREATEAWAARRRLDLRAAKERLKDVFARANSDAPLAGEYGEDARLHRWDPAQDREPDAELAAADRARGELVLVSRSEVRAGQGFAFSVGFHNGGFLVTHADRGPRPGTWRVRARIAEHGPRLPAGLPLFRNADHERKREATSAMAAVPLPRPAEDGVELELRVSGAVGAPLRVEARSVDGRSAAVSSAEPIAEAAKSPLDGATLRDSLGAFGGSGFRLARLTLELTGRCFLPAAALKRLRREMVEALAAQTPTVLPAEPAFRAPETAAARRRETRLWVAVRGLEHARAALDAGAAAAWLDDPALDLWAARAPRLPIGGFAERALWLRHPATAPLSPHLGEIGLPVVAGHLGALDAAHAAGLPTIADAACNVFSTATIAALAALGAEAAVLSLECSSREIARLAARLGETPTGIAVVAAGRLPAMLTRQDHGLVVGATTTIRSSEREGGLPYELQRRRHDTVVWEGRRLCAPEQVAATAGLVDGWVLELSDLDAAAVAEVVAAYAALRDGRSEPEAVREAQAQHAPLGTFTGHLHQGSRELDEVAETLGE